MNPEIDERGNKYWHNEEGQLHREDGPAVECISGAKSWYINGKHHRVDGPAAEWYDGSKSWYYHGKWMCCGTQEEFERLLKLRMFW